MTTTTYDAWKARAPEDDGPMPDPCPICTGDEDADPCTEDCADIVQQVRREREIQSYLFAIRQVVKMAVRYRAEGFPGDERVSACLAKARYYRSKIRALRAA